MTPDQKSLVNDFTSESQQIVNDMQKVLEDIESGLRPNSDFAHFAQRIDGIMGCAKTLGLDGMEDLKLPLLAISNISEGCKTVGYKASQVKDGNLASIIAGFMADALEILEQALDDLSSEIVTVDPQHSDRIRDRLNWLGAQMKLSAKDQAEILARFGLK